MKKKPEAVEKQEGLSGVIATLNPESIQEVLLMRAKQAALEMAVAMLEDDAAALCGDSYSRKGAERKHRGGSESSSIVLNGARYGIRRPRVRDEHGEVILPTLSKLRDQDLLDSQMQERMIIGVSSRNYKRVIDGYTEKLGVSKSSVSRAFIRASQKELDAINEESLEGKSFVAIVIDGIEIGGRTVVAALGITPELEKIPLGLREGDTENTEVVRDLLSSLQERGFTLHCQRLLAVIDGGKALRKGLKKVFGDRVLLQRCWIHKLRNIKAYLPEEYHGALHWKLKSLMSLKHVEDAQKQWLVLHRWLSEISPDAAQSLEEARDELLTLHVLGVSGELRKSLSSTNIIESLFSVVREKIHRVRNWKSRASKQTLRWAASAINAHKKRMRKLRGVSQAHLLIAALGEIKLEKLAA